MHCSLPVTRVSDVLMLMYTVFNTVYCILFLTMLMYNVVVTTVHCSGDETLQCSGCCIIRLLLWYILLLLHLYLYHYSDLADFADYFDFAYYADFADSVDFVDSADSADSANSVEFADLSFFKIIFSKDKFYSLDFALAEF